jgi:hypothetical protein
MNKKILCEMCEEKTDKLIFLDETRQNICKECFDIWKGNKKFDKVFAISDEMKDIRKEYDE